MINEKRLRTKVRGIVRDVLHAMTSGRASKALASDMTDRIMNAVRKEVSES